MNLPPTWNKMGFTDKAAYLCSSKQARNYPEACAMLSHRRRKSVRPGITVMQYQAILEKRKVD